MRIAIATKRTKVSENYTQWESIIIVKIKNEEIVQKEEIQNSGIDADYLPKLLHEKNVNYIIVGEMHEKAQRMFKHYGIKPCLHTFGSVTVVLERLATGDLKI